MIDVWMNDFIIRLNAKKKWKLSRTILFDRNRKFVAIFWKIIFNHLKIVLLFITAYHSQKDDQSKKTNQILKIALKFALMKKNCKNVTKLFFFIHIMMNNFQNVIIKLSFHEILYEFKMLKTVDLLNNDQIRKRAKNDNLFTTMKNEKNMLRKKIDDAINFAQTMQKIRYNNKHKKLILKKQNKMFLKLHKKYTQSDLKNRKFDKQRIDLISVLIKIKKLVYKLNILNIWKIHFVVSVTYLKSASEKENFYKKNQSNLNQLKLKKTMKLISTKSKKLLQKELFASKKKNADRIRNLKWNELNETIIIISEWNEVSWLIAKSYWLNLKQFKEFSFKKFIHFDWSSLKSFKKHNFIWLFIQKNHLLHSVMISYDFDHFYEIISFCSILSSCYFLIKSFILSNIFFANRAKL